MTLSELQAGQSARVGRIASSSALKSKLIDMGVIRGERIHVVRVAPLGDPVEVMIRHYTLTLRKKDAEAIAVEEVC